VARKFGHLGNYTYVHYRFVLESLCQKHLVQECLVLDAGCGSSGCSLSYVPETATIVGVDVSKGNILKSKQKVEHARALIRFGELSFVVASLTHLPFKKGIFDLIVCVDVLEHIGAKRNAISEMSRVSKSRARLVGSTTNLMNPLMLFDSYAPEIVTKRLVEKFAGQHFERRSRLTPAALTKTMNEVGYQVNHMELFCFPPFRPWIYQQLPGKKRPWFSYLWMAFNEATKNKPLNILKGNIVFEACRENL